MVMWMMHNITIPTTEIDRRLVGPNDSVFGGHTAPNFRELKR